MDAAFLRAATASLTSETLAFASEEVLVVSDSKLAPDDRLRACSGLGAPCVAAAARHGAQVVAADIDPRVAET
jgi:hypothetical protein